MSRSTLTAVGASPLLVLLLASCGSDSPSSAVAAAPSRAAVVTSATAFVPQGAATTGTTPGAMLGAAVTACDLDGDGLMEIVSGAPGSMSTGGTVQVVPSAPGSSPSHTLAGSAGSGFGASLLCVPDLDGDGIDELAVGAPTDSMGTSANVGAVHVFSGSPAGVESAPVVVLYGSAPGAQFGTALAAGDLTGDGAPDLAVGAPFQTTAAGLLSGSVAVFAGAGGALGGAPLWDVGGETALAQFGSALAIADVVGSPAPDLIVGAPMYPGAGTNDGQVVVLETATGAPVQLLALVGTPGAMLGSSLAVADFDGDGRADLAAGEPGATGRALVSLAPVVTGSNTWFSDSWGPTSGCGATLTTADLDGAPPLELVVGCPDSGTAGDVHVVQPPLAAWPHAVASFAGSPGEAVGSALAALPAQGGDGARLIVGIPSAGAAAPNAGAVTMVGLNGAVGRPILVVETASTGPRLAAGDLDEDGWSDLVFGSPVIKGVLPGPGLDLTAATALGLAGAGNVLLVDLDADGFTDLLAEGPYDRLGFWGSGSIPSGVPQFLTANPPFSFGSGPFASTMCATNMDDDRGLEVFVAHDSARRGHLFDPSGADWSASQHTLRHTSGATNLDYPMFAACDDFDGDGYGDVVMHDGYRTLDYFLGGPTGLSLTPDVQRTVWGSLYWSAGFVSGDFDGDGSSEQLVVGQTASSPAIFVTSMSESGAPRIITPDGAPLSQAVADFNRDGLDDLALLGGANGRTIAIHLGSPTGLPDEPDIAHALPDIAGGWETLAAGDVNSDGLPDLLLGSSTQWLALPVGPPGSGPVAAMRDTVSVVEGGSTSTSSGGAATLLANDLGTDLTAALAGPPAHGSVSLAADGAFTYTHDGSESPSDSFTYELRQAGVVVDTQTVAVTVFLVTEPPIDHGSPELELLEGDTAVLPFDGVLDPDGLGVIVEPDCDGDGIYEPAGTACAFPDDGMFVIDALATDPDGMSITASQSVLVENVPPAVDAPGDAIALVDRPWQWTPTVSDPGDDTFSFSRVASPLDAPLGVHVSLGTVTITPSSDLVEDDVWVWLTVEDDDGGVGDEVFVIDVQSDDDGDGMGDQWELAQGLDPSQADAAADPDGDGLSNAEEYAGGTDPLTFDGPTQPSLMTPDDDALDDAPTHLRWAAATDPQDDPLTYRVQVVEGEDPTATLWDVAGLTTTDGLGAVPLPIEPSEDQLYSWRVRAADPRVEGPWSAWGRMRVLGPPVPPPEPVLIWPRRRTLVARGDLEFVFAVPESAADDLSFVVEITRDGAAETQRELPRQPGSLQRWRWTESFPRDPDYRWRVHALEPRSSLSETSPWERFEVDRPGPSADPIELGLDEDETVPESEPFAFDMAGPPGTPVEVELWRLGEDEVDLAHRAWFTLPVSGEPREVTVSDDERLARGEYLAVGWAQGRSLPDAATTVSFTVGDPEPAGCSVGGGAAPWTWLLLLVAGARLRASRRTRPRSHR